eukprot:Skav223298  [mRNA]  locus=scaffold2998:200288:201823:+ [translate_table: standard]
MGRRRQERFYLFQQRCELVQCWADEHDGQLPSESDIGELVSAEGAVDPSGLFADDQNEWHTNLLSWVNHTVELITSRSCTPSQRTTLRKHASFAQLMPKSYGREDDLPRWWRRFRQLKRWISASERVPGRYTKSLMERKLGWWLAGVRQSYFDGALDQDRLSHLWMIPPVAAYFTKHLQPAGAVLSWDDRFSSLQAWLMTQSGRLPKSGKCSNPDERQLAVWLQNSCVKARKDELHPERMAKLKEVPGLRARLIAESPRLLVVWQRHYDSLVTWLREHGGRLPRGSSGNATERLLAFWLHNNLSKAKDGDLTTEKQEHLQQALGVYNIDWGRETGDGRQLQEWVSAHLYQKYVYTLTAPTSGWRDVHEVVQWDTSFKRFEAWCESHGRLPKRNGANEAERSLANWLSKNCQRAKAGKLDQGRFAKLRTVSGVSDRLTTRSQRRMQRYKALEQWRSENGGALPVSNSRASKERELGVWLRNRVHLARQGKLPPDELQRLQAIAPLAERVDAT